MSEARSLPANVRDTLNMNEWMNTFIQMSNWNGSKRTTQWRQVTVKIDKTIYMYIIIK